MKYYNFKDLPYGMFLWHGVVYTKFNETQGVMITTGKVVTFDPMETVYKFE